MLNQLVDVGSAGTFFTSTNHRIHALRTRFEEGGSRHPYHFDTVYFDGKYRYGRTLSNVKRPIVAPISAIYDRYVTLYDGNPYSIVWNYGIKEKDASPLSASCFRYFQRLMQEQGESRLRAQYKIPSSIRLDTVSVVLEGRGRTPDGRRADNLQTEADLLEWNFTGPNFYVDNVPSWGKLAPVICPFPVDVRLSNQGRGARQVGSDVVCGRRCVVLRTAVGRGSHTFWVDPKTRFVMRSEGLDPSFATGNGNYKWAYTQFEDIAKADASYFALPVGTTVYLPELMRDYPLPKGMIRAKKRGPLKILGFPLYPNT